MANDSGALSYRTDTAIVGAGLAGIVAALELLERGREVMLIERGGSDALGGLALQAFGGMHLVDTPLQRRMGIRDSRELALEDWESFAEFEAGDHWPRRWAELYVARCVPDVYDWLGRFGVHFIPAVQWAERGWYRPGNTVPRYHVVWGTARHLVQSLLSALHRHPQRSRLAPLYRHRVAELLTDGGKVVGCAGETETTHQPFRIEARHVVVAGGGITGNLAKVRAHWPRDWGTPPQILLNGSHPEADGALHDAVAAIGGRITHLDCMWNYAAGVRHPQPRFPGHGLSLIPCKSALWLDHTGRRIGPEPLVTGFDTRHLVERVSPLPHSWQLLNRRIAERELAVSGAEHNPLIRDRRPLAFAWQTLAGNRVLVAQMLAECEDFVSAPMLPELVQKMNRLAGDNAIDAARLEHGVRRYDEQVARGSRFHNDDQLRRIAQLRQWFGDRVRTCNFQRILDPAAGPLIAIREQVLTRKTLGGIQTDLDCRVLGRTGEPIPGLYAIGEAAGFGGGGASGKRSLEGTCLSGCVLTARQAARAIGAAEEVPAWSTGRRLARHGAETADSAA